MKYRADIEGAVKKAFGRLFKNKRKMDFVISQGGFEKYFQFEVAAELDALGFMVHVEGKHRSDILILRETSLLPYEMVGNLISGLRLDLFCAASPSLSSLNPSPRRGAGRIDKSPLISRLSIALGPSTMDKLSGGQENQSSILLDICKITSSSSPHELSKIRPDSTFLPETPNPVMLADPT